MTDKQKELAYEILQHYGFTNQKMKAIEELGELIVALSKHIQGFWDLESFNSVVEEMADVKIMIQQMEITFGSERINTKVDEKLQREISKIRNTEKSLYE